MEAAAGSEERGQVAEGWEGRHNLLPTIRQYKCTQNRRTLRAAGAAKERAGAEAEAGWEAEEMVWGWAVAAASGWAALAEWGSAAVAG